MFSNLKWFYVTRLLGVLLVVYGLLLDRTGERGTIILAGLGMIGYDRVARTDSATRKDDDRRE